MITTSDKPIADRLRLLINHGQSEKYLHTVLGYNYRMTDIAAAIGIVATQKTGQVQPAPEKKCGILYGKPFGKRTWSGPKVPITCSMYTISTSSGAYPGVPPLPEPRL